MDEKTLGERTASLRHVLPAVLEVLETSRYDLEELERACLRHLLSGLDVDRAIVESLVVDDVVAFRMGSLEIVDRSCLWVLIHEILIEEGYYFRASGENPVIIDAGAHIGLSVMYFKSLYPRAKILAFEPYLPNHELLARNVKRNHFTDVEISPRALCSKQGPREFHAYPSLSMAGSLTSRLQLAHVHKSEILSVECDTLSQVITGPIDLLKLDVEGVEDGLLCEAGQKLKLVKNIICEFHEGAGLSRYRLVEVLVLLRELGFEFRLHPSFSGMRDRYRPMDSITTPRSMMIFASRQ